jgi:ABC-type nitrate/sulfonate/bicarbonate transport system ATPase subunit
MQQKDLLLPWRTVLDNTTLGLELKGLSKKQAREQALEYTEAFGLKGFEHQYPFALSGGMRQRAAFLRTMLMDQDVVLLDEPFGALDALTRIQMQEWLLQLWESLNKTIVLITHDVDEALLLSDRVYLMSARPGRATLVLDVDLPRPRHYDMVTMPDFSVLKAQLMEPLRAQSQTFKFQPIKSFGQAGS